MAGTGPWYCPHTLLQQARTPASRPPYLGQALPLNCLCKLCPHPRARPSHPGRPGMCVYVCMCIYMYRYVYVYIYVCMYVFAQIHACACIYVCKGIYAVLAINLKLLRFQPPAFRARMAIRVVTVAHGARVASTVLQGAPQVEGPKLGVCVPRVDVGILW